MVSHLSVFVSVSSGYLFKKVLGHFLQGNGFSPDCVLKCVFKLQETEKVLGH